MPNFTISNDDPEDVAKRSPAVGAIVLFSIGAIGLLINLFIVINMYRHRSNFNKHTILFINVAVGDLLVSVNAVVFRAPGFILQEMFYSTPIMCLGSFYYLQFAFGTSIWSLVLITLDRYIAIMHPNNYNKYLSPRIIKMILLFTWLIIPASYATVVTFGLISTDNFVIYDDKIFRCSINRQNHLFGFLRWYAFGIFSIAPSTIHIVCYTVMLFKLRSLSKMSAASYNLIKTCTLVLLGFTCTWLPSIITEYATKCRRDAQVPGEEGEKQSFLCTKAWSGFCILLFYSSVVSNPIIYSLSLSKFRQMLTRDAIKIEHESSIVARKIKRKISVRSQISGRSELSLQGLRCAQSSLIIQEEYDYTDMTESQTQTKHVGELSDISLTENEMKSNHIRTELILHSTTL